MSLFWLICFLDPTYKWNHLVFVSISNMTSSAPPSAASLPATLLVSHFDYCSDPKWVCPPRPSPPQFIHYTAVDLLWKEQIKSRWNLRKSQRIDFFFPPKSTNPQIFILAFKDLHNLAPCQLHLISTHLCSNPWLHILYTWHSFQ